MCDVVVDDALGIGTELDAAMAQHVESYRDEWAETLTNSGRLRRFRSFVNAPTEQDASITHVAERGQRRPATELERAGLLGAGITPYRHNGPEPVLLAGGGSIRFREKE